MRREELVTKVKLVGEGNEGYLWVRANESRGGRRSIAAWPQLQAHMLRHLAEVYFQ